MKFSLQIIQAQARVIEAAAAVARADLPAFIAPPSSGGDGWRELGPGDRWGGAGQTWCIRVPLRLPDGWDPQRTVLRLQLGDDADLSGPEALAYLDGAPLAGFDRYHRELSPAGRLQPGVDHELMVEAYSSLMTEPQTFRGCELLLVDPDVRGLANDLRAIHDCIEVMDPDSVDRADLTRLLERGYHALDLRDVTSEEFRASARTARRILGEAFQDEGGENLPRTVAVGHAHIDLAWLWPVAQTRRKGARTFSTALRLMERFPAYHFVASQPALYEMVRQDEPEIFEQITERIREGRWEPVGASWVEMDCNLAGGEALIRQFVVGKRYFREELGVDPRVLWLPDVFGYSAALPQILLGCDVDGFMTTKISWNEYNRLPYDTFRWRGIDGTEVLTHMVTAPTHPLEELDAGMPSIYTYNAKVTPFDIDGNWRAYRQKSVNHELLYLFGWGDGGGGPTNEMLEMAERLEHLRGFNRVEQSSAEAFFERLRDRVWDDPDLPRWVGELYLEYHRGTYTSQGWIKRANRKAELLYREAELWLATVAVTEGVEFDVERRRDRLAEGWKSLLFHQFHDILPGSSIHAVYDDARRSFGEIEAIGREVLEASLSALLGPQAGATPEAVVVLNPAPFEREDPLEVPADEGGDGFVGAETQRVETMEGHAATLVAASAPSLGYALWDGGRPARTRWQPIEIDERRLENVFFAISIDDQGHIASLVDKRVDREVIAAGEVGNRLIAYEDRPVNFDAWDIQIDYADKPYPIDEPASIGVIERGPLRGGLEIVRRYGDSTIRQRMLIFRDMPRIDFVTHIDWHEHQTLLKAAFPVSVNSASATYDIQWGNVERPTHWNTSWDWARFESCAHRWVDLSEGDYGVSLLNDCKYGHDITGHTIRLTLLKSGIYPDPQADQGEHLFTYSLLPHPGDWRQGETVRHAALLNMPQRMWPVERLPALTMCSLVRTDRPGLVIETVKPAEDGDGIVVRAYDAYNTRGRAELRFQRPIRSAERTNLLEEWAEDAAISDETLSLQVRPYGIHTYRVRLGGAG